MKKQILTGVLAALVGVFAVPVHAQITNSKHNLSATPTGGAARNNSFGETTQICVFCHTPHGADVSNAEAPLWNKTLPTGAGYQPYGRLTTTEGLVINSLSGTSLACLSCHDGSQAIDNMMNSPGSGNVSTAGWTAEAGNNLNAQKELTGVVAVGDGTLDLRNDHPIGIQYCGGGYTDAAVAGSCADTAFRAPMGAIGSDTKAKFWVNQPGQAANEATKDKNDLWLYNRQFAVGNVGPSVECASCHDVHTSNNLFMRYASTPTDGNKASELCLACHIK